MFSRFPNLTLAWSLAMFSSGLWLGLAPYPWLVRVVGIGMALLSGPIAYQRLADLMDDDKEDDGNGAFRAEMHEMLAEQVEKGRLTREQVDQMADEALALGAAVRGEETTAREGDLRMFRESPLLGSAVASLRATVCGLKEDGEFPAVVAGVNSTLGEDARPDVTSISEFFTDDCEGWNERNPGRQLPEGKTPKDALSEFVLPMYAVTREWDEVVVVAPTNAVALGDEMMTSDEAMERLRSYGDTINEIEANAKADAVEMVTISHITGKGVVTWTAPVGRDPRGGSRPTLGEFEKVHAHNPRLELTARAVKAVAVAHALGTTPLDLAAQHGLDIDEEEWS